MSSLLEAPAQKRFLKDLFSWYKKHGRHDMPWRHTDDPYAIFISEFMLQQTTVTAVKPYYERFLNKLPTIAAAAAAPIDQVLALWSGLGYYARARNLWSAMQKVEAEFGGQIPSDLDELLKLPGVGPYTAGAISTIAFNRPAPVLDGNIIRVLLRMLAIDDDPKFKPVQVVLRKVTLDLSQGTLAGRKWTRALKYGPRDLSLALMDLGATVCLPKNPLCSQCPVAELCLAKQANRQDEIPKAEDKIERPTVRRLHAIVVHKRKWLMGRRPKDGLFGGLWEFVGADAAPSTELVPYLEESVRRETTLDIQVLEAMPAFEHQLSHRVFVVRAYLCDVRGSGVASLAKKGLKYEAFKWVQPNQISRLGLSAITKRIINTTVLKMKNTS